MAGVAKTNCTISVKNYGERKVRVTRIHHGISVISDSSGATRNSRDWFARVVTSGSFAMSTVYPDHDSYESMADWLAEYGRRLSAEEPTVGVMRITVPSRNFDRLAVCAGTPRSGASGIAFGARWNALTYVLDLNFVGTSNPTALTSQTSRFERPRQGYSISKHFYPGGYQQSGNPSEVGLYDNPYPSQPTADRKGVV